MQGLEPRKSQRSQWATCLMRTATVRTQFILSAQQSKGGQTRTVYLNQRLRKALREYGDYIRLADPQRPLFASQKGGHFSANTMCQLFSGHIQSDWPQGRLQSLRPQDIHYAFGQQGCRRALAGLTHEELETLQSYDKLEVKVERLVRDVLVQKALKNSFRYKL